MTANTWAFGDYIEWVFDDWLDDRQGRFIAAEHIETGRLAAIGRYRDLGLERIPARGPEAALSVSGAAGGLSLALEYARALGVTVAAIHNMNRRLARYRDRQRRGNETDR